jgi:hypothetical protein
MLPPTLIRRLVLAPLVIVIAAGFLPFSPFLAVLALVFGLLARSRAGHIRGLRLVGFVLVWFVAETVALVMLTGLWVVSGFGGRLRTKPYQSRLYGVMRWFLDLIYPGRTPPMGCGSRSTGGRDCGGAGRMAVAARATRGLSAGRSVRRLPRVMCRGRLVCAASEMARPLRIRGSTGRRWRARPRRGSARPAGSVRPWPEPYGRG